MPRRVVENQGEQPQSSSGEESQSEEEDYEDQMTPESEDVEVSASSSKRPCTTPMPPRPKPIPSEVNVAGDDGGSTETLIEAMWHHDPTMRPNIGTVVRMLKEIALKITPGKFDGEPKVVRNGNVAEAYNWNEASHKWVSIGEVVNQDSAASSLSSTLVESDDYHESMDPLFIAGYGTDTHSVSKPLEVEAASESPVINGIHNGELPSEDKEKSDESNYPSVRTYTGNHMSIHTESLSPVELSAIGNSSFSGASLSSSLFPTTMNSLNCSVSDASFHSSEEQEVHTKGPVSPANNPAENTEAYMRLHKDLNLGAAFRIIYLLLFPVVCQPVGEDIDESLHISSLPESTLSSKSFQPLPRSRAWDGVFGTEEIEALDTLETNGTMKGSAQSTKESIKTIASLKEKDSTSATQHNSVLVSEHSDTTEGISVVLGLNTSMDIGDESESEVTLIVGSEDTLTEETQSKNGDGDGDEDWWVDELEVSNESAAPVGEDKSGGVRKFNLETTSGSFLKLSRFKSIPTDESSLLDSTQSKFYPVITMHLVSTFHINLMLIPLTFD
ncbi:hypothetical protein Pelo_14382 [Pelomyxa schiedti]|nr:hypothetical protein Pelo_14382 [Pelomyxa schiedti]